MSRVMGGFARFWEAFMSFNKQFDSTLFICLTFYTLWRIMDILESGKLQGDSLKVITDYAGVFSHILSAIVGALFMKAAMNESSNKETQR